MGAKAEGVTSTKLPASVIEGKNQQFVLDVSLVFEESAWVSPLFPVPWVNLSTLLECVVRPPSVSQSTPYPNMSGILSETCLHAHILQKLFVS